VLDNHCVFIKSAVAIGIIAKPSLS